MESVAAVFVTIAAILLIGTLGEIVFQRTRIPDVIWLLLVGLIIGPLTGIVSRQQLIEVAPIFGAFALVIVLFDGASQLKLKDTSQAAVRAGLLAVFTFAMAVLVVAVVSIAAKIIGWLPAEWTVKHAILLGAILGGPSSIIILPSLSLAGVKNSVANIVGLESALTDALCVVGATVMIDIITNTGLGAGSPAIALAKSFSVGIAIGLGAGLVWLVLLQMLRKSEYAYPITLAALLLLYVLIDHQGGSAALGILTFAIVLGNAKLIGRILKIGDSLELSSDVRGFHRQVTFIIKSFFFTFIGAMLAPPWSLIALGLFLGVMLLIARVLPVKIVLYNGDFDIADRKLMMVAMPRGLAAGVLATIPLSAGITGTEGLPTVVFATVIASILVFAIGLPIVLRSPGYLQLSLPQQTKATAPKPTSESRGDPAMDTIPETEAATVYLENSTQHEE